MSRRLRAVPGILVLLMAGGCASSAMDVHVPDACFGPAEPFSTYTLEFVGVPGFIEQPIETAERGALADLGLTPAVEPDAADVRLVSTFFLVDRNPPPQQGDPMGEPVQTGTVNRFVAHLRVDLVDQRSDAIIWTGSMYRDHAIAGGETFHDERAVLIIRQAFDEMFVGLTTPCR